MRSLPEKQKRAVELYQSGTPVAEISKQLKTSYASIYGWLKKHNIQYRRTDGANITKRYLIQEYVENKRSLEDLAEEANTSVCTISKALIRHGLDTETLWNQDEPLNWLHPLQEQLIYGSLLGDAYLEIHHGSGRLKFEHGISQKSYCEHKLQILKNFTNSELKTNERYHNKSQNTYTSFSFKTKSSKLFYDLHPLFYQGKYKYVNLEALAKLDDRGLTYWFQDDGFKTNNILGLSTDSFLEQDRSRIIEWFKTRWNVEAYSRNLRVLFKGVDAYKLEKIVAPNLLPEFRYKIT